MTLSKRGRYENPLKSPWSFEFYDSLMERQMMDRLEKDNDIVKWQKRHDVSIPWIDSQGRRHNYRPDFLVEFSDGRKTIIEVKNPTLIESSTVQRKRKAAEEWCRKRGMLYELATVLV